MDIKNNAGIAFINDKKATDKHHDYKGILKLDNKEYFASIWNNISKNNNKYLSFSIEKKKDTERKDDFNDSIPF